MTTTTLDKAAADKARIDQLVRTHLLLVHKIANKYLTVDVDYDDLVGAGNIGLVKAAQKFEPERGLQFSTYATYWIRALMLEALERIGGRRLSREERKMFYHENKARKALGMDVTDPEIAASLGIKETSVAAFRARRVFSLDAVASNTEYGETTYGENMPSSDPSAEDRYASVEEHQASMRALEAAMRRLSAREREVVQARFYAEKKQTLEELGSQFGFSRERVRQIEARALQKLRKAMEAESVDA
jgi:RNA polymerase sigma-32 factor